MTQEETPPKFRVWHKRTKEYIFYSKVFLSPDGKVFSFMNIGDESKDCCIFNDITTLVEVELFVIRGGPDNVTDIFQGDRVSGLVYYKTPSGAVDKKYIEGKVVWIDLYAKYCIETSDQTLYPLRDMSYPIRIMGTIHDKTDKRGRKFE